MQQKIMRKYLLGFMQIHILHHAKEEPIYGTWMMEELHHHGYDISQARCTPFFIPWKSLVCSSWKNGMWRVRSGSITQAPPLENRYWKKPEKKPTSCLKKSESKKRFSHRKYSGAKTFFLFPLIFLFFLNSPSTLPHSLSFSL